MSIESRLQDLGLTLPAEAKAPSGVVIAFSWARVFEDRLYLSGHGPQAPDGSLVGPFGRVGAEVSEDQAAIAARLAILALIASANRAIGDLDRIAAWARVDGYVLVAPGFDRTTGVINSVSRLIVEVFGDEVGRHARTAMGVAATPLSCPVVIAAEVVLRR